MWWQLAWSEESASGLTTRLGWSVKMRSMQDEELGNRWVGSFTNCCKPYDEVRASSCIPSGVFVLEAHHYNHQAEL